MEHCKGIKFPPLWNNLIMITPMNKTKVKGKDIPQGNKLISI